MRCSMLFYLRLGRSAEKKNKKRRKKEKGKAYEKKSIVQKRFVFFPRWIVASYKGAIDTRVGYRIENAWRRGEADRLLETGVVCEIRRVSARVVKQNASSSAISFVVNYSFILIFVKNWQVSFSPSIVANIEEEKKIIERDYFNKEV